MADINIVKWITDSEIELFIADSEFFRIPKESGIRLFKHPKKGSRLTENSYYIRYNSDTVYASGAYQFPVNPVLQEICLILHQVGFIFWGSFKTEISPYDYMQHLQYQSILKENFKYLRAGENTICVSEYKKFK